LSTKTKETYKLIRSQFKFIENDLPQFENIKQVISLLKNNSIAL